MKPAPEATDNVSEAPVCSCRLCVEEAVATAAWREHKGSLASFVKNPPPHVNPLASLEVQWAIGFMLDYGEQLRGYERLDRLRRELSEVFLPKKDRGRPSEPYTSTTAALKLERREALMEALKSDDPADTPPLWPTKAGDFEKARRVWKGVPHPPSLVASVWACEIEDERGAEPPQGEEFDRLVEVAAARVDSWRKAIRRKRRTKT